MKRIVLTAITVLASATISQAVDYLRVPGSVTLSDGSYWTTNGLVANATPGNGDVAVFDGATVPDVNPIAYSTATFYPGGWKFADIQGAVSFDGNAYLYGNGVVVETNAAADVTFNALRVGNAPGFGPMTIAPGRTVTTTDISTSSGKSAYTIQISGGGTFFVNGWASATSSRMMFNVSGSGTTIGGNGTWAAYWANSGYGMQIGADCFIAPGTNAVGTMTINNANAGQTALIMADGSGFKFDIGSGGTYALPSDNSDQLVFANVVSNDVVFQGTTTIDCLGTGSNGVFKLLETSLDETTWSGLALSGQEITGGLVVTNYASGYDYSLILGDGTTGDAGDIYLVVGEPPAPYTPGELYWAVGNGVWDIDTSASWDNGSGAAVYYEEGGIGDAVSFNDMVAGPSTTVMLDTDVYPSAVTVDSANDFTITGTGIIKGSTSLTKSGIGTLTVDLGNSDYSGGTTLGGGTVVLSAATTKLGAGAVTMTNDALLVMVRGETTDSSSIVGAFANQLIVPAGEAASVWNMPRGNWSGALAGSGTLNLRVNATRGDFTGDWSAFAGQINVTTRTGADDFRIALGGGSGLQLAAGKLNLADGVNMYQTVNPPAGDAGTVHNIGELSGTAGAILGAQPIGGRYANWTIGALNTDSTFAGLIQDNPTADPWGGFGAAKLTKVGTGTLTLSGTNTYSGATTVNGGVLYISGIIAGSSANIASNAAVGGSGTIETDLIFNDGAQFAFNGTDTLIVSSNVTFSTNNTFGVDDLVVDDWSTVSDGTYTLINGFTNTLSGLDGAEFDIGAGRVAHLEGSTSLLLVVGAGSTPPMNLAVSGGSVVLSWDNGGTYNVLTNSTLQYGVWGVSASGPSPVSIPIGSESTLFYKLSN